MSFTNREDAGQKLVKRLTAYKNDKQAVVVALPRGGVTIGRVVADTLGLALDVVVPRKLGSPNNPEYAIGAITEEGHTVWNETEKKNTDPEYLKKVVAEEQTEAKRRLDKFRADRPPRDWQGKTVIVVDDGVATGYTMRAALKTVSSFKPAKIVLAVPVAPAEIVPQLEELVDELVVINKTMIFWAVGAHYSDFAQVSDKEVVRLLSEGV